MDERMRQCRHCNKYYETELEPPSADDKRKIQDIYPDALPYQREQLKSDICSDKCWDEHLWGEQESTVYDENGRWVSGGWRAGE